MQCLPLCKAITLTIIKVEGYTVCAQQNPLVRSLAPAFFYWGNNSVKIFIIFILNI